ncbi:hypothetical protein MRX96_024229 [Rhipicephalus microplus]
MKIRVKRVRLWAHFTAPVSEKAQVGMTEKAYSQEMVAELLASLLLLLSIPEGEVYHRKLRGSSELERNDVLAHPWLHL